MTDLKTSQTFDLFKTFAERWQKTVGSQLLLLSDGGEILANANGAPSFNWPELLKQTSPHQPSFLTHLNQSVLIAPLLRDNRTLGYLLTFDARQQDIPLLTWGADVIMEQLVGEEALQNMTDELIGAWNQLALVFKVTQNMTLATDLMTVLYSILQEIQKVVDTEDGFILLYRSSSFSCVTCAQSSGNHDHKLHSDTLLNNLAKADHAILCETATDCRKIWPEAPPFVENMLAIYLPIEEGVNAALGLINKADKNFTAGDTKLLSALVQQVGVIIKNFLIHQTLIIEERLSRELEIAAEIQKSMLPTKLPQIGGLTISVASVPASEVGGDFYDFISRDERHLTLVMGDVAGKGIPAAMLTSVTRTMLRVEALRGESPYNIIQQANNVLHQDFSRTDSFVTVAVATIDTFDHTLSYASAGHMPVILWRAETGEIEQLKATSLPIGIFGYEGSPARTVTLKQNDTLVLYTDGITESQAANGDFFGIERLIQIIKTWGHKSPDMLKHHIQSEIADFRQNSSSGDDATLLILKMLPQPEITTPKDISTIIKTVEFSYVADIQYLTNISEEITATCRQLPALPPSSDGNDFIALIELAISEICTNVIKHAYADMDGRITGSITLLSNGVQLDFYDQGSSFDPNSISQSKVDPYKLIEGGYGLHIVRQIMDVISYEHDPQYGNHWHLIKFLPAL